MDEVAHRMALSVPGAIQGMIQAADRPSAGIFAGVIGIVSLLAGAIGVGHHQRERPSVAVGARHCLRHAIVEQHPIRSAAPSGRRSGVSMSEH